MRSIRFRTIIPVFLGAALLALVPANAQRCNQMELRLWQPDGHAWFEADQAVEIVSGEEGHIYIHLKGRSATSRYSTSANIGYPKAAGAAQRVRNHVQMVAQNGDDRRDGRIRLTAAQPGETVLSYTLTGAKPPGDLSALSRQCLDGQIRVRVLPGANTRFDDRQDRRDRRYDDRGSDRGQGRRSSSWQAADQIVQDLYHGILRRDRVEDVDRGFVQLVNEQGLDGIEQVAISMTTSDEFRREALRRTEDGRGRRLGVQALQEQLLDDIYSDLYPRGNVGSRDRNDHLDALDRCLSGTRGSQQGCTYLARGLVSTDLYYANSQDLINRLDDRQDRRPGRF